MPVTIDNTNSALSTTGTAYSQATADPLTIAANGYLLSTVDDALLLNGTSQAYTVTVNGDVSTFAAARAGIYLSDLTSSAAITVGTTGHVYGNGQGIYSAGLATITNNGSIAGATGVGIYNGGNGDFTITNHGRISSDSVVAISLSGTGTHSINNSGTIKAATGQDAIQSTNPTGLEIVYNNALIDGNVNLGGGHDEYYGSFGGTVQGSIIWATERIRSMAAQIQITHSAAMTPTTCTAMRATMNSTATLVETYSTAALETIF